MMVVVMSAECLRQILDARELIALRGIRKVSGQLIELVCQRGIALRLSALGARLEVRSDLLGNLLVLRWVRLLNLLENAHQLGEGRKPAVIGL
jgi:hypothetical protein